MSARTLKNKGFTLVEILIVVVILGILAAIVIPQFTQASESARASSLKSQLQTIRSQLELYQIQHQGEYPTLAQLTAGGSPHGWSVMTGVTNEFHELDGSETAGNPDADLGPYLQKAPVNPFTASSDVATDNTASWEYTAASGAVRAVIPTAKWADAVALGFATSAEQTAGSNSDYIEGP